VTFAYRRVGELAPPTGNSDYFWRVPGIYFGDYLEVSTGEEEVESPLSWRGYEFQVRNPEGQTSGWITFTYPFDDEKLLAIMRHSADEGRRRVRLGDNQGAIEPLRKAMVFADRILGIDAPETCGLRDEWNAALDNSTLDKLRFEVGTRVRIVNGTHEGKSGTINSLGLRQTKPYWIDIGQEGMIAAADDEVEVPET
jgi:hypothetical protein